MNEVLLLTDDRIANIDRMIKLQKKRKRFILPFMQRKKLLFMFVSPNCTWLAACSYDPKTEICGLPMSGLYECKHLPVTQDPVDIKSADSIFNAFIYLYNKLDERYIRYVKNIIFIGVNPNNTEDEIENNYEGCNNILERMIYRLFMQQLGLNLIGLTIYGNDVYDKIPIKILKEGCPEFGPDRSNIIERHIWMFGLRRGWLDAHIGNNNKI